MQLRAFDVTASRRGRRPADGAVLARRATRSYARIGPAAGAIHVPMATRPLGKTTLIATTEVGAPAPEPRFDPSVASTTGVTPPRRVSTMALRISASVGRHATAGTPSSVNSSP